MKKINSGIGKRIKGIRIKQGLTQDRFGGMIGVSQRYVGMMESGKRKPSQWLLEYMAKVFNVSANWFRTGRKD